eukprot:1144916-Pelagomonas_calceolata.AAC.16
MCVYVCWLTSVPSCVCCLPVSDAAHAALHCCFAMLCVFPYSAALQAALQRNVCYLTPLALVLFAMLCAFPYSAALQAALQCNMCYLTPLALGCGGQFSAEGGELFLGNAGTAMRPLTAAVAAAGRGKHACKTNIQGCCRSRRVSGH